MILAWLIDLFYAWLDRKLQAALDAVASDYELGQ